MSAPAVRIEPPAGYARECRAAPTLMSWRLGDHEHACAKPRDHDSAHECVCTYLWMNGAKL